MSVLHHYFYKNFLRSEIIAYQKELLNKNSQ